ncbi:MAG: MurT ligase domain-containing protein [Cyanobacteria bacterium J06648_16]
MSQSRTSTASPLGRLALTPIVLFAKLLTALLKASGRGSGTALPGLLVNKYAPWAFEQLVSQIPTIVAVTGTNGKTTTQTMLSVILNQSPQLKVLQNKAGANLKQGILSELLKQATLWGKLNFTHAVLEVEEATLPKIAKALDPTVIAVTNLYRDQLDAYGEIDVTERYIHNGIAQCEGAIAVLNGDDPRTARLTRPLQNETHYVSLPHDYSRFLPYEGDTSTIQTDPDNTLSAAQIHINDDLTTTFTAKGQVRDSNLDHFTAQIASPGFFHVYNALTAITIAKLLGVKDEIIQRGLAQFEPAFGRGERVVKQKGNKSVTYRLLLVKNPASFTLNLNLLKGVKSQKLILAINDNTADGKDVSWLWDSELEVLNEADVDWIVCTGVRAQDMRLRLKYAFRQHSLDQVTAVESMDDAIEKAFDRAENGDTIFVLPTYTAMLYIRKRLGRLLE